MSPRPDLILEYSHHLADRWAIRENVPNAEVRVRVASALNGRPPATLIDPDRDLARIADPWRDRTWILPLATRVPAAMNAQGSSR